MTKVSKREALNQLWNRGELLFKLDSNQKQLHNLFYNVKEKINVWLLSRRSGKSFSLLVLALEQCIKRPNSIVKYVAPTKMQLKTIIRPLMKKILEDCPSSVAPEFKNVEYIYYFANGSEIQLAGSDSGHAEKLRGGDAHLVIIDEAGSVDDLDYIIKSILLPTTLTTRGKILIAGTPAKMPDHPFVEYIERAEARGTLVKKTVYDNPRLTKADIDELIEEVGGVNSADFRRELLCELIKDPTLSVLPEFTEELEREIVREWERPPFYDTYESMDLGYDDLTFLVFAYYDFRAAKLIIEDELVFDFKEKDNHIAKLAELILKKEFDLWNNPLTHETKELYKRVSDIEKIALNELYNASKGKLRFEITKKDDKETAINNLRIMLASKKVIINPRCKTLISHLRNVKWRTANDRKVFARSADSGHFDGVDATIYLARVVNYKKNPYPAHYDYNQTDLYVANTDNYYKNDKHEILRKMFNIKIKRRET